jgi:hypothetical protein
VLVGSLNAKCPWQYNILNIYCNLAQSVDRG